MATSVFVMSDIPKSRIETITDQPTLIQAEHIQGGVLALEVKGANTVYFTGVDENGQAETDAGLTLEQGTQIFTNVGQSKVNKARFYLYCATGESSDVAIHEIN